MRKFVSAFFAFLIVSSAFLAGAGGSYSAVDNVEAAVFQDCDLSDSIVTAFIKGLFSPNGNDCRFNPDDSNDWDNVSATDAYSSALSLKDYSTSYTTTNDNFLQDTRSVAYSKAKIGVVNDLNNGTSATTMAENANITVDRYYSRMQMNIIQDWNAKVVRTEYLRNTTSTLKTYAGGGLSTTGRFDMTEPYGVYQYQLANGTMVDTYAPNVYVNSAVSYFGPGLQDDVNSHSFQYSIPDSAATVEAQNPEDSTWTGVLHPQDYHNLLTTAQTQATQVKSNMGSYTEGVNAQYEAGQINVTDLAQYDPAVVASEASTDLNSTGYNSYAAVQLAALGYNSNLTASHVVTVGGTNYTGTMFYTAEDSPTAGWATGETYDFANYSGVFYMAHQPDDANASARIINLEDYGTSFTIQSATDTRTGEALNTTTTQKYTYSTTNASNLEAEIDQLIELREFYEEQATESGSGTPFDFGGVETGVIVALLAVVFLMSRD